MVDTSAQGYNTWPDNTHPGEEVCVKSLVKEQAKLQYMHVIEYVRGLCDRILHFFIMFMLSVYMDSFDPFTHIFRIALLAPGAPFTNMV